MFGINQISWTQFGGFILLALFFWYLSIILTALSREKRRKKHLLFEETDYRDFYAAPDEMKPLRVSCQDLPSHLIAFPWESDIPLPASFYEETGLDEGYAINCFIQANDPGLSSILEQVQNHQ